MCCPNHRRFSKCSYLRAVDSGNDNELNIVIPPRNKFYKFGSNEHDVRSWKSNRISQYHTRWVV